MERNLHDLSHASMLVFSAGALLIAGILAGVSLSLDFGVEITLSFVVVTVLFPLAFGWLLRERWRARELEGQIQHQKPSLSADQVPSQSTVSEWQEFPGWKIQDIISAEGFEKHSNLVLRLCGFETGCCFDMLVHAGPAGERSVRITMAHIAPRHRENCLLVVVEDLHQGCSRRSELPEEGMDADGTAVI